MKYLHPDNAGKEFVDWRLPERRKEMFFRWLKWRVRWSDLDHYAVTNSYRDATGAKSPTKAPMTKEQQYWMSLIFGMTYQSSMAWTIYWEFPDFWDIDFEKMQAWNVKNLERQRYARDTKYNKGRVTDQTTNLREIIKPYGSIQAFFERLIVPGDEHQSFENCFNEISKFYKYGRMTSWLTCQNLFEVCGLPIRPRTMLASDPSNWSVRTGIMYLFNRDDMIESGDKKKGDEIKVALSKEERTAEKAARALEKAWVEKVEIELYEEALTHIDPDKRAIFSNYLLESHLCQYKKLLTGGDYGGHSSGDHVSRCTWLRDRWPEINYQSFYEDAVQLHHPLVRLKRESPALRKLCQLTGQVINMHQSTAEDGTILDADFADLPDMHKELELDGSLLFDPANDPIVMGKVEAYASRLSGAVEPQDIFSLFQS